MSADPSAPLSPRRVLRMLVLVEIICCVLIGPMIFLEDRFLPPLLQEYRASEAGIEFDSWEFITLAAALVVALVVGITSWVALWRGWRSGRRLYSFLWLLYIPMMMLSGPVVSTWWVDCFDSFLCVVGGAILSLLYFSDLRLQYGKNSRMAS